MKAQTQDYTEGVVGKKNWRCPKCRETFMKSDLGKNGTCPDCDTYVRCTKVD